MNSMLHWRDLPVLLRGDEEGLLSRLNRAGGQSTGVCVGMILIGAGLGGAAMGAWRSPEQALFTGIKLPLILLLTTLGNSMLNAVMAPLLGLNLGFRQSALAILFSFAIAAVILGVFSPLVLFLVWNLPPMSEVQHRGTAYALMMVTQVAVIGFAGVAANLRLLRVLQRLGGVAVGRRVLVAWLAGNFLLGTQLTWLARPFFGSPGLPVQFLRDDAMRGTFFEALWYNFRVLFT
ncbi:MAG: hypothetical protein H7X97_08865 [Opitutaceae bacterium]|nr:hypothetical protein [Verrucomicrobiales bacterium]